MSSTPTQALKSRWLSLTLAVGLPLAFGGSAFAAQLPSVLEPVPLHASIGSHAQMPGVLSLEKMGHVKLAHGNKHHARGAVKAVAELLNMKPRELVAELRQGKTLAQVLEAHGKSKADAEKAIRAAVQTRLQEAVKAGRLTQKQADERLKAFDINRLLNTQWPKHAPRSAAPMQPNAV